jgi:hypothetical protein
MSKHLGENLARTEDGGTYNKLQRPDNWPAEAARSPVIDDGLVDTRDSDREASSSAESLPDEEASRRSKKRKRIYSLQKRNLSAVDGCLPLDDEDFSELGDDSVSFAAIQYLKGVR